MHHKLAVIDIGSNAIRCLIAQGSGFESFHILKEERIPLRLGGDAFVQGFISETSKLRLYKIFTDWKLLLLQHEVNDVRAVATSALRNASNSRDIVKTIHKLTDIRVEIISGQEEGRLVKEVLLQRLPNLAPLSLCVDIGGGSVEYTFKNKIKSLPLGTVRLLEQVSSKNEEDLRLFLRPHLLRLREEMDIPHSPPALIGTGGNLKSLSRLANRMHLSKSKREFSEEAVRKMTKRLFSLSFKQRQSRLKLSKDRADVILPAACLVDETCRIFNISRVFAPSVGLKEGLLLDTFLKSNH